MVAELTSAFKAFEEDQDTKVAVIHAAGGNFSVGYDLEEMESVLEKENNLNKYLVSTNSLGNARMH